MPLEKVTFDIYMYLPCTDLNLKTTLKNIFQEKRSAIFDEEK